MSESDTNVFHNFDISGFFDELQDPLVIFESDKIIYINKYFRDYFEVEFKNWEDYFNDAVIKDKIISFFNNGRLPNSGYLKSLKSRTGCEVRYEWIFVNLPSPDKKRMCFAKGRRHIAMSDLMEKENMVKLPEDSTLKDLDYVQKILRYSHDMIAILDAEGKYKFISSSIIDKLGFQPEQIIGKSYKDFISQGLIQIETGKFQDLLESKKEIAIDFSIIRPNGKKIFIESFGRNLLHDPQIEGILFSARDITVYKKTESSLKKRFELENLINRISAKFVNACPKEYHSVFNDSLKMLGEFENADRAYIFLIHEDLGIIENVYEWAGPGIEPQINHLKNIPISEDLLTLKSLRKGEFLVISDVSKMSEKYGFEKDLLQRQGIKSVVLIPFFSENRLIGFFGLDAVSTRRGWHEKDEYVLRQLGDIFAGTFINKAIKKRLERNENLLASTEILAKSGSWQFSNSKKQLFFSKGLNKIFDLEDHLYTARFSQLILNVAKKDRASLILNLKTAIENTCTTSGNFTLISRGNKFKYINYSIQVRQISGTEKVEIYGYCSDVTHKQDAENYLRLQSQILAQVNDPIFVTDLSLKIIYMNKAALQECQIESRSSFQESINSLFEFLSPDEASLEEIVYGLNVENSFRKEINLKSRSNTIEPYEVSIQVFLNDDQEKIGYSFLIRNLSLQLKQEALAKKAKMIVENSPAVLFTLDPNENFKIIYVTENINQFGYNAEQLINNGTSILEFIHPDDAKEILHYHFSKKEQKGIPSFSGEYRILNSDGEYRWVEDKTREVLDNEGKILLHEGLLQDITERKINREEILRSQKRYRVLASNIPLTNVFLIDRDLRYIVAEGTNFVNWGMSSKDFEGKTLTEVHRKNLNDVQPAVVRALIKKQIVQKNLVFKKRVYELTIRPIVYEQEVEYALGIVRDINEEFEAKENLKRSEEKYRRLVEESTEIIFSLSSDLLLTYVSPNVKQFLDYEPVEVLGQSLTNYMHPEDLEAFCEIWNKEKNFLETNQYLEFKLRNKNGTFRIFSSNGKVIHDHYGNFSHYTGIARDITSLKEAQKELFHAKEKAELASKIKSQFLSIMSHEIRTPMNAVIGMAHLLIEDNPRPDQLENLKTLQFSAENLLGLINDILDYTKIDSGKIELEQINFELTNVLNRIIHSYSYQIREKNLDIFFEADPNIPKTLLGDPVRLAQIINNLVSNAIKFTEEGFVKISITKVSEHEDLVKVRFVVEDSGIGIPPEKLESVFEAFTQASTETTRRYGGTGLGLAIVKRLIDLFGSKIHTQNRHEGGTCFTFDITFGLASISDSTDIGNSNIAIKNLSNASILVAEDNLVNQIMIKKFLKKWEVKEIHIANDGVEAIEAFKSHPFNLILLDLQMPAKDGYEVAEYIRKHADEEKRNTPIIALTASSLIEVKEQIENVGIDDYISKPFNPDNLYAKIIKHLKV